MRYSNTPLGKQFIAVGNVVGRNLRSRHMRARQSAMMTMLCLSMLAHPMSAERASSPWSEVSGILQAFQNLTDCDGCGCPGCGGFAFTAGDASGRKFSYEKGVST